MSAHAVAEGSGSDAGAGVLLRLLSEGASTAELLAVEADPVVRELAVRVRADIASVRRREAQLEALLETAKDLAAMRDPAGVLEAIVRRARTLLRSDLAYLTLHDPERGDTYMRATSGSTSATFQSVRLPLGSGLGGLVASTRKPYATRNYARDARFRHTTGIDSAVGDEGIIAILGTPLLVGERFVGVLFAGQRDERTFDHEEVNLLGSLATLAAVSLVQLRTLLEAQTALEALSAAHETVRRHTAGVERAAAAHDRFAEVVLSGGGLDDVTRTLSELLGGWVVLLDDHGVRRSVSGDAPESGDGTRDALADQAGLPGVHVVPIRASGDDLGLLAVGTSSELDDADRRTIERAAVVSALVLLFQRDAAASRRQFHADLLADLVAGRGDRHELQHAGRTLGVNLDEPWCVLAIRGVESAHRRATALSVGHALGEGALVGEHDGAVIALLQGTDPRDLATALVRRLAGTGQHTVAGSGPHRTAGDVPNAVAEARRALDALVALGREGEGAAVADLGFAGLVVGKRPDISAFIHATLGPVLDYDAERGTDLAGTLDAWFAADRSPRHAATGLHVHSNTVAQRIDRVTSLLGPDWQRPDRSLEVRLALHLRRLVGDAQD
jgi:hypothetical protein